MSKKTEFLVFILSVAIFASGFSSMLKYNPAEDSAADVTPTVTPEVTVTPTVIPTPTPTSTPTPTPEPIVITPEPTEEPTPTPGPINLETDDADIQEIIDSVQYVNDTEKEIKADEVFVSTVEEANREILKIGRYYPDWNSDRRTLLYTDVNAIRTAEAFVEDYPWLAGLEIMHTYIYTNCVVVIYELKHPTDNYQLLDALSRRDNSRLAEEYQDSYALVADLAEELGLDGMNEFEIVKTVNDYMTLNTAYDFHAAYDGEPHSGETSYSYSETSSIDTTLDKHMSICGGYSRTFAAIMTYCGILCRTVTGTTEDGGGHAWNQVRVEGEWYNMDVTWNDPMRMYEEYGHLLDIPGSMQYNYFLLTDKAFYKDHTPDSDIHTEECTSTKGRQYLIDCYRADSKDEIRSRIEKQKNNSIIFVAYSTKLGLDDDAVAGIASGYLETQIWFYYTEPELGYRLFAFTLEE